MAVKSIDEQAAELVAKFQKKGKELDSLLAVAMNEAGIKVEADAALLARHDTGLLRKSITHRVISRRGYPVAQIGTNNEYAIYVEFGTGIYAEGGDGRKTGWMWYDEKGEGHWTRGMKPKSFLREALKRNKINVQEIVTRRLKQAI